MTIIEKAINILQTDPVMNTGVVEPELYKWDVCEAML